MTSILASAAISATTPKRWNVFLLEIMGHRPAQNRASCPETCRAIEQVPNMIQAFFSILEPGKSVPEHEGPYLGYLRYHLGVRVPVRNPPKLVVNGQDYVWKEGEAVLFDDSWPHSVVNHSEELARRPDRRRASADAARGRSLQSLHHRRGRAPYLWPLGRAQGRSVRQCARQRNVALPPDPESSLSHSVVEKPIERQRCR